MNDIFQIEKFNEENYFSWSIMMKAILKDVELWDLVSSDNNENTYPPKAQNSAYAILLKSIEPRLLKVLSCHLTARSLWRYLENRYAKLGEQDVSRYYNQLATLKLSEDLNADSYVNQLQQIFQILEASGQHISEIFKVTQLLNGLPKNFHSFLMGVEVLPMESKTFKYISTNLLNVSKLIKEDKEENEKVLIHKNDYQKCDHCGKKGHSVKECWELHPHLRPKRNRNFVPRKPHKKYHNNIVLSIANDKIDEEMWILDSGSTCHITNSKADFIHNSFIDQKSTSETANGEKMNCDGKGTVEISFRDIQNNICNITLKNVKLCPDIKYKIISEGLLSKHFTIIKKQNLLTARKDDISFTIRKNQISSLFKIKNIITRHKEQTNVLKRTSNDNTPNLTQVESQIHKRFGHLVSKPSEIQKLLAQAEDEARTRTTTFGNCDDCKQNRQPRKCRSKQKLVETQNIFEVVHTDVCGPIEPKTPSGGRYILTLTDDYSRYIWVFIIPFKSNVFQVMKQFSAHVENQYGQAIQKICSDNGTEFTLKEMQEFLNDKGIVHIRTAPYTPYQNPVAERANRTLIESARCMLNSKNLPKYLWGEAVSTAAFLKNRQPREKHEYKCAFELLTGSKPAIGHIREFGSVCYLQIPKVIRRKLDSTSQIGILLGYDEHTTNYRILDSRKRITYSRDVIVDENKSPTFFFENRLARPIKSSTFIDTRASELHEAGSAANLNNYQEDVTYKSPETQSEKHDRVRNRVNYSESRKYTRQSPKPNDGELLTESETLLVEDIDDDEPTLDRALTSPQKHEWEKAIDKELSNMESRGVWSKSETQSPVNIIDSKFVLKIKRNENNDILKYKVRLFAKGFKQSEGIDYEETYAPVSKTYTMFILLVVALSKNYCISQLDFEAAYLNADLDKHVYFRLPQNFKHPKYNNEVLKLNKAIYGLKQSGRQWNQLISSRLKSSGWEPCLSTPTIFIKNFPQTEYLFLYVDDLLLLSPDDQRLQKSKHEIMSLFPSQDLGGINLILGIKVDKNHMGRELYLNQNHLADRLLKKYNSFIGKPSNTPLKTNTKMTQTEEICPEPDLKAYQSIVGSLLYLSRHTRPELSFAVNLLSRNCKNPNNEHFQVLKTVLGYLHSWPNAALRFKSPDNLNIVAYCDSDWAGDPIDRISTSGYAIFLGNCLVSWCSKKQKCIALSAMEAEYLALAEVLKELKSITIFLSELKITYQKPIVYCDNKACLCIAKEPREHQKSKHIDIRYHFARQMIQEGFADLQYIQSKNNLSDVLTKPTSKNLFHNMRQALGVTTQPPVIN